MPEESANLGKKNREEQTRPKNLSEAEQEALKTAEEGDNARDVKIDPEDIRLKWRAREYVYFKKDRNWYYFYGVIGAALLVYSIFERNYLLIIITFMTAIIITILGQRKPRLIDIIVTDEGIKIDKNFYNFTEDLQSFWILYNPPQLKTLNFARKGAFMPSISIQLEDQNPLPLREFLLQYLDEDLNKEESVADRTARNLGL